MVGDSMNTPQTVFPERSQQESRNLYFSQFEDDGSRPPTATAVRGTELRHIRDFIRSSGMAPQDARALADEWILRQAMRYRNTARRFSSQIEQQEDKARFKLPNAGLSEEYGSRALNLSNHIDWLHAQAGDLHETAYTGVVFDVNDIALLEKEDQPYEHVLSRYAPPDHMDFRSGEIHPDRYREDGALHPPLASDFDSLAEYREWEESGRGQETIHTAFEAKLDRFSELHEWFASSVVSIETDIAKQYGDEIAHAYNTPERNQFVRDINSAGFALSDKWARHDDMFKPFAPSFNSSLSEGVVVKNEAVEWAGYAVAREVASERGYELQPLSVEQVSSDARVQAVVQKMVNTIATNSSSAPSYSDSSQPEFIGFEKEGAAAEWAGLLIAREELATNGIDLPSLSPAAMAGNNPELSNTLLERARDHVESLHEHLDRKGGDLELSGGR
jgi:hypothetical protein